MYPALMSLLSKAGAAMSGGGSAAASGIGMTGAGSMGGGGASAPQPAGYTPQQMAVGLSGGQSQAPALPQQPQLEPAQAPSVVGGGQSPAWMGYRKRGLF